MPIESLMKDFADLKMSGLKKSLTENFASQGAYVVAQIAQRPDNSVISHWYFSLSKYENNEQI
jgi:hypothetical protein